MFLPQPYLYLFVYAPVPCARRNDKVLVGVVLWNDLAIALADYRRRGRMDTSAHPPLPTQKNRSVPSNTSAPRQPSLLRRGIGWAPEMAVGPTFAGIMV